MFVMQNEEDLRQRLLVAAARLCIGEEVEPREMVMLACDLIVEDPSGEATLELAIQSPAQLTPDHTEVLLRELLAEWGIDARAPSQSAEIVALDMSRRLLDGTLKPRTGGHLLLGVLAQGVNRQQQVDQLLRMLDRLEDDLGGRADDAFRAGLEALAGDILRSGVQP
jgi:hypothetical protein